MPLPPLSTQRRIVAILDEAFAAIDRAIGNVETNLGNVGELWESCVGDMLQDSQGDWERTQLGEACMIIMGQSPPSSTYNSSGKGVPLINGPVEFGGTDSFARTLATKFTTAPSKMCKEGDLILCVRGSTTGRMNIAGYDSCIGRGVAAIRSKSDQEWVNQFIDLNQSQIFALGTGSTFPNVSAAELHNIMLPLPPPPVREAILQRINVLRENIAAVRTRYRDKIEHFISLKQSLLHQAFTGRLTSERRLEEPMVETEA